MSNFKRFLEIRKINRQISALQREILESNPVTSPWNSAIGWQNAAQPAYALARPMSEKEILYRQSINDLIDQRDALKVR